MMKKRNRMTATLLSAVLCLAPMAAELSGSVPVPAVMTASAASISDMPSEYQYAADWIWTNRIQAEQSTARRNTIFDQIVAGKGSVVATGDTPHGRTIASGDNGVANANATQSVIAR